MLNNDLIRHLIIMALLITATGCARLPTDWQLKKTTDDIQYYTRQSPLPRLPEYKAVVIVDAALSKVKQFLMDFDHHPEWVFGCEKSKILALDNYSDATIYQITRLPIVRNRDIIMAATTASGSDKTFSIRMASAPDFCNDKNSVSCKEVKQSRRVRVTQAEGEFLLTPISPTQTQIQWTQYLDPAGSLPVWLYRANLAQVPIKTLKKLKAQLEQP